MARIDGQYDISNMVCSNNVQLICAIFLEEWELEMSQTAKVTFKVTQGHWYCAIP